MVQNRIVYQPLLGIQGVSGLAWHFLHVVIARCFFAELLLVVSSAETLVAITANMPGPIVIDVDVPAPKQVGFFFRQPKFRNHTRHLMPVLESDLLDVATGFKVLLVRHRG
jgi:hypothetical protein